MKKLKLESFRIAKLSNSQKIFGGNGTDGGDGTDTIVPDKPLSTINCPDEEGQMIKPN